MQTKMNKEELLDTLKDNRLRHRTIFEEAVEGYHSQAVEHLHKHITEIKSGKLVNIYVHLAPTRRSHTRL